MTRLFFLFFFFQYCFASVESDNCAAIAAGFPVYIATQLCVTCPTPAPTERHVSSAAETLAVIVIGSIAAVLAAIALFVCCFLYLWFVGATRRVSESAGGGNTPRRAQLMRAPQPPPRQYEFTFAQNGTAPGSYVTPVRQLPARHETQVEFAFAAPGAAPGATAYILEPGPAEPAPLVTPHPPPGAPSVVEIRFAEPGQQVGVNAQLVPDPRGPSGADLFTMTPASARSKHRIDPEEERRGRSRSPRSGSISVPTRLRRREVAPMPAAAGGDDGHVFTLVESEQSNEMSYASGPVIPLYHPRQKVSVSGGLVGAVPLHLQ